MTNHSSIHLHLLMLTNKTVCKPSTTDVPLPLQKRYIIASAIKTWIVWIDSSHCTFCSETNAILIATEPPSQY